MNEQPTITIRPVEDRDCEVLATFLSQSTGLETTAARVQARLAKSRGVEHPIVAELGDSVAGFASLKLTHCLGEDGPYAEVTELFVAPSLRRNGIGAALLADLERQARAAGATGWSVIVDAENVAALGLYRKQGFGTFAVAMQQWFSEARPFRAPPKT